MVTADWIEEVIRNFLKDPRENSLKNAQNDRAWADPLIGFSMGSDPIFLQYKEVVGPFHWTPEEIFRLSFFDDHIMADELTVISWILPQAEQTKLDNRKETLYPSERWARAKTFGEEVNVRLRNHVVEVLKESGVDAVAPMLSPLWGVRASEHYVFSSTWSERHAAYASGLGTFGLCDGLITEKGKAVRCGSVVANVKLPPTSRAYQDHHAYCLFYSKGTCKKCIQRCPVGAITEEGHDKNKCRDHVYRTSGEYVESSYGFKSECCGLCQTGVPCESKNPVKNAVPDV